MGSRVGFHCFGSAAEAKDYYFSQQSVMPLNNDGSYSIFQKNKDTWYQVFYNSSSTPSYSIQAANITFPECDPEESFLAGMELSSLIVIALLSGFAIKHIMKMFGVIRV